MPEDENKYRKLIRQTAGGDSLDIEENLAAERPPMPEVQAYPIAHRKKPILRPKRSPRI